MKLKRRAGILALAAWLVSHGPPRGLAEPAEEIATLPPLVVPYHASTEGPEELPPLIVRAQLPTEQSKSPRASAQPQTPVAPEVPETPAIIEVYAPPEPLPGWLGADFLLWSAKGDRLPPLITASPPGTPRNQTGVLGAPGTVVLFGDERVNDGFRPGLRLRAGSWLDAETVFGVEGSVFYLDPDGASATAASPGSLGRPFINANGQPDAQLVSLGGVLAGSVHASADSTVWGGDINALTKLVWADTYHLAGFVGYRHLHLSDTLNINENLAVTDPAGPFQPGTRVVLQDRFRTSNSFHGGVLGLRGEYETGRVVLRGSASLALGWVHQTIDIAGATAITPTGLPTETFPGGLLALQSNSGRYERDQFAILPSVAVNAAYRLTRRLHLSAGYDLLYLSRVTRPGDVIDLTVNPALLPPPTGGGPPRPAFLPNTGDYWLQGLSFGMQWMF